MCGSARESRITLAFTVDIVPFSEQASDIGMDLPSVPTHVRLRQGPCGHS